MHISAAFSLNVLVRLGSAVLDVSGQGYACWKEMVTFQGLKGKKKNTMLTPVVPIPPKREQQESTQAQKAGRHSITERFGLEGTSKPSQP